MPSIPSGLKAVVFDFDGTIFDTETTEFQHWQAFYREHGRELSLAQWQQGVGTWDAFDPWQGLPEQVQTEKPRWREQLHQRLLAELREQELRSGVRAILQELSELGLRLAIASSSDRAWIEGWLEQHGLRDRFEVMATRDEVRRVKPDPELYSLAVQRLQLRPEQCLAVEDSFHGATAAVAAGLSVVVVPNDVTRTQPFDPRWPRLEDGYGRGAQALLAAFCPLL